MTGDKQPHSFISCAAVFVVSDIDRSVAFYRDKLGFLVDQIWGEPPSFAIADTPQASIMLKQAEAAPQPNSRKLSGLWDVYIWVSDLEPTLHHMKQNGVAYSDPEDQEYGCREVTVTDPDGYIICFGYCP